MKAWPLKCLSWQLRRKTNVYKLYKHQILCTILNVKMPARCKFKS
ncbi:hypothetical protein RchiOBHm_Chr6g0288301 [Rosa chinensis]|uniref:Uncharacterized protein n=1 Tax=Rosa chinensis TaxID=74649 RepID=A0A2P6PVC5_ROSCH|nr:hypothetical protein RchiOBHm_Chr6g0288301 [Rosa chinensis]